MKTPFDSDNNFNHQIFLMQKLRWRRYWWEKVADVVVRKGMNEGNGGKF